MHAETITYQDHGQELEAFVAYPSKKKMPLVILCHAWKGKDDFICEKTREVASLGYVGFALDMYGKGVLGKSKEENVALKKPFIENREMLQKRVLKAYEVASHLPFVDATRIVVLGYGFGGVCALDLARSGVNLKGAISVYGHFDPPPNSLIKTIQAKILVLHGYNDPVVSQAELQHFEHEMNAAKVDWQAHVYGNAMHAFATSAANDPASGILYNPVAASRAWSSVCHFLAEVFT